MKNILAVLIVLYFGIAAYGFANAQGLKDFTGTGGTAGGGGTSVLVEDVLTSTSTTNALSANQGSVLDGRVTTNSTANVANTAATAANAASITNIDSEINAIDLELVAGDMLRFTDNDGNDTDVDLSTYLDDTNLARITSASIDANNLVTFTRDDATTMSLNLSNLASDFATVVPPPSNDAVGAVGTSTNVARGDHKHPAQTPSADANNLLAVGTDGLHLISLDASGFSGTFSNTDDTLQELFNVLDGLNIGSGPSAPSSIADLAATSGDTEVFLTHTAPSDNGSVITDYVYDYKPSALTTWNTFSDGVSNSLGTTVTGLTNFVDYDFRVTAVNAVGSGPVSNIASATPTGTLLAATVHNSLPDDVSSESSTDMYVVRSKHTVAQDTSNLLLSFSNFYMSNTETNTGNDFDIVEVSIENSAGTTVVPVTFSSNRNLTIADGAVDIQSDFIDPVDFGLTQFTKNEEYFIKATYSFASGANMPFGSYDAGSDGTQAAFYDSGTVTASSVDLPGQYNLTGGPFVTRTQAYTPIILGSPIDATTPTYITVGDSIANGFGDNGANGTLGRGFIQRAMTNTAGTVDDILPNLNFAKVAIQTVGFTGTNTKWQEYIKYANRAIDELGTNDVGGRTLAQMLPRIDDVQVILGNNGIERIYRTSLLARTLSTDNFTTLANQSYENVVWEPGNVVDLLNQDFASKDGTVLHGMDYVYVDLQPNTLDPVTRKWLVNGTANYPTSDGVHPSAAFHEIMAVDLRPPLRDEAATPPSSSASTILFASGVVQTGQTITAHDDGSLTGSEQWFLNNAPISGATSNSVVLPTVTIGDVVHVEKDGEVSNSITYADITYETILNAANTSSLTFSGTDLTQIDDTSGNNRHATPSTANGVSYVTNSIGAPNTVTDILTVTPTAGQTLTFADGTARTGPRTIMFAFKSAVVPTGFKRFWSSGGPFEQNLWQVNATQDVSINAGTFATTTLAPTLKWDDQPNLWVVRWDDAAGTAKVWKNGGAGEVISNAGSNPGNIGYTLFGDDPAGGDNMGAGDFYIYHEFDAGLTDTQINALAADIPAQFGLPAWSTAN